MERTEELLVIIPARGDSKRLKRKNMLPVEGVPLFIYTARRVRPGVPYVIIVSTDDDEIATTARLHGYEVHRRPVVDDKQTIPQAAALVAHDLNWEGPVLLVQPTVVPLPEIDIPNGSSTSMYGVKGRDQVWVGGTHFWSPKPHRSIGIYYWPSGRVGEMPRNLIRTDGSPVDIDTPVDYRSAIRPSRVVAQLVAPASTWAGTGHSRRQETLALYLQDYDLNTDEMPDAVLVDRGNNHREQIEHIREGNWYPKVVVFEDRGTGAPYADAVINALLPHQDLPNEYVGGKYAILRPEFLGLQHLEHDREIKKVAIIFGGTDAKELGAQTQRLVRNMGYTPLLPPFESIPETLIECDLLISGAGQIVHEAAYLGTPNVVIAATQREASHGHLGHDYGNIFLGLAAEVTVDQLTTTVRAVFRDKHLRREMTARARATVDGKGHERVRHILEGLLI